MTIKSGHEKDSEGTTLGLSFGVLRGSIFRGRAFEERVKGLVWGYSLYTLNSSSASYTDVSQEMVRSWPKCTNVATWVHGTAYPVMLDSCGGLNIALDQRTYKCSSSLNHDFVRNSNVKYRFWTLALLGDGAGKNTYPRRPYSPDCRFFEDYQRLHQRTRLPTTVFRHRWTDLLPCSTGLRLSTSSPPCAHRRDRSASAIGHRPPRVYALDRKLSTFIFPNAFSSEHQISRD